MLALGFAVFLLAPAGRPLHYWGARPAVVTAEVQRGTGLEAQVEEVGLVADKGAMVFRLTFDRPVRDALYLAVVGENGAGKTTLVKLLCKLYEPTAGRILVDGAPLSRMRATEWRSRLAGAFQDFFRFEFVARHSVGLGEVPRMDEPPAVAAAVARAGAEDVVARLPAGLETQLGPTWPGGVEVSFGQWQKLALARGFMREQPLVLVLDEPTGALDAETEHALFERYAAAARGGTRAAGDKGGVGGITILVSHRFSTVRMADLIVVLGGARVAQVGSHEELMAQGGPYAELYGIQAAGAFRFRDAVVRGRTRAVGLIHPPGHRPILAVGLTAMAWALLLANGGPVSQEGIVIDIVSSLGSRLRAARRRPGVAAIVVTTLAVGIGANTAIFSAVDNVLLKPLPYNGSNELVAAFTNETRKGSPRNPTSPADFLEWKKSSRTLDEMTGAHPWSPVLTGRGQPEPIAALKATPSLFSLLRASAALGQVFSSADDVVVLSHRLWQRRFGGDRGIVGQSLTLDGKPYAVAGVMPPGFEFPPFWATGAEVWTPLRLTGEDESNHSRFLRVFARRRPGITLASSRAEMEVIGRRLAEQHPAENAGIAVNVEALQEPVVSQVRPALWMLMGAVGLVLLIACANVTSLLLAQGLGREREIALRIALGANRAAILRELLTDSVVLAFTGGLAGLGLAKLGIELLRAWSPPGFPRLDEIGLDGRVVVFNLLLSLVAGILSGLVPALRASRAELTGALRQGDRVVKLGGAQRIHDALVVTEFALALVLLVGAGLLTKSFLQLMSPRPGFQTSDLLTLSVSFSSSPFREPGRQPLFLEDLLGRVRSVPGVESAALVNHLPISGDTWSLSFTVEGQPQAANDPPSAVFRVATPDYLKTMGIALVHGRAFTPDDRQETPGVVIVNRTLARRFWGEADPVGSRIKQGAQDSSEPWLTVVGVAEDTRQSSLIEPVRAEVLFPYTQNPVPWFHGTTLVVRTAVEPLSLAEPLKAGIWSLDPDLPLTHVQSMAQVLSAAVGQERFNTSLLGVFALTAVFLAVLGMYGVMAYAVTRRRHEIGVRMALGAPASRVFGRVVGRALVLSLLGAALGLACAQALSGILGRLLVGVSPHDPSTTAFATALLLTTSLLASAIPAHRAAQADPLVVLREE